MLMMKIYRFALLMVLFHTLVIIDATDSEEKQEHDDRKQQECGNGATHCESRSGVLHGCCPYHSGVCCYDGKHCCPEDFACDIPRGKCNKKLKSIKLQNVFIPQIVCFKGRTRCVSKTHGYCCPFSKPVCCPANEQCCPHGYTCDVSNGICNKSLEMTRLVLQVIIASPTIRSVQCPGGKDECLDNKTCCKLSSGKHGCCPHSKAICCADGKHCCPHGYICDSYNAMCVKQNETARFRNMTSSVQKLNIVCPGGEDQCLDGSTCCKSASGGYGCCLEPNAVCCSNGKNCCPHGYTCDLAKGLCDKKIPSYKVKRRFWAVEEDEASAMLN